jgi:type IV pilus assembly protein PilM
MARRLIGLDVGTNAVTVAEVTPGNPPRLDRFGQVAMPPEAMREGEVVDDRALIDALSRLRLEVGLKREAVRLGIASPRAVVRQVEMPEMSRDDLAGALQYQAADLIPIPMDEAVLDFAILDHHQGEDGSALMSVLLVAAHAAPTTRLVEAVESAGFAVAAIDLLPIALIRALAHGPALTDEPGAESIVSFGGGVTAIAVHENGVPKFVRVLGTGGRELTAAIANVLNMPFDSAEALKRQLAHGEDELTQRARAAIERPLAVLLDDVRSSIDYYRNQPGATRLRRVVVTGGASQLPGLPARLGAMLGLPVEPAAPRSQLAIGDIGFPESEYPRLDPYLPAAVGLALHGAGLGTVVDLRPRKGRRSKVRSSEPASSVLKPVLVGAAVLIGLLGVPTFFAHQALADKRDEKAAVEAQNEKLQESINSKADVQTAATEVQALNGQVASLLSNDVSWSHVLQGVAKTMPNGVWLSSFDAHVDTSAATAAPTSSAPTSSDSSSSSSDGSSTSTTTPAAPATPPTPALTGTVTIAANARTYSDVAAWMKTIGDDTRFPMFSGVWVSSASATAGTTGGTVVNFSSNGTLTETAHSNRAQKYQGNVE